MNRVGGIVDAATVVGAASQLVKTDGSGNVIGTNITTTTVLGLTPATTATPSSLVKRDGNGTVNVNNLGAVNTGASLTPLFLKGAAGQVALMENVQNSAGTILRSTDTSGNGVLAGTSTANNFSATSATASVPVIFGKAAAGQTAFVENIQNSGGTILRSTDPSGNAFHLGTLTAPSIGPTTANQHALPNVTSDTVALTAAAQTFANKTLTAPVLGGTVTGTYTLGGTPSFASPLSVPNGGVGLATWTAHGIPIGNGTGAPTFLAPGAANNFLLSNGTDFVSTPFSASLIADRTLTAAKLQPLALFATTPGASLGLTMAAGSFTNSAGVLVTVGAATVTPTATAAIQFIPYYLADNGTLTAGTIGTTQATASIPVSSATPVGALFLPANATGVYSTQADFIAAGSPALKGYVLDRPLGIAGNANASGIQTSATLVTVGAPGTSGDTSGLDYRALLGNTVPNGTVNGVVYTAGVNQGPSLIATGSGDAGLDAMLAGQITPSYELFPGTVLTVSGTSVLVAGGGGLTVNGRWCSNANAITVAASGTAGIVYIFADRTGGTGFGAGSPANQFGVVVTQTTYAAASPAPTANQRLLGRMLWDGAALFADQSGDFSQFGQVLSSQIRLGAQTVAAATTGGTLTGTAWCQATSVPLMRLRRARATNYLVSGVVRVINPSASTHVFASIRVAAGGTMGAQVVNTPDITGYIASTNPIDVGFVIPPTVFTMPPGVDDLIIGASQNNGANTATFDGGQITVVPFSA